MQLSGHTKPFAVLGHPIGHTLSPVMHNASMQELEFDGIYLALDVHPDRLMEVLPSMALMGFAGVNLTVPHKEVAFRGLEKLDASAKLFGAANTIEFTDGGMVGHNTDGYGFLKALEEAFGKSVEGDSIFVLGCGGAGRATALQAATEGAKSLVLADIDAERVQKLNDEIIGLTPNVEIVQALDKATQVELCRGCDLVVQASPVGMRKDDPSLLPPEAFRAGQRAFDLIYMYPETAFLTTAREAGTDIANGLGMLLHQGARAFGIWTGAEPSVPAMRKALEDAVYGE
ncbi:shikimate dehydrogenase [Pontiella sulfatireligans]|uniref:Shikimate dehydrogenase (NADP(+)) n=1 Tax=Pontiella sulfatireligans TaxID=2750658 RepID=A0A6C2UMF0_9BACT|nr:shikimate dehydrogenase [Pontiella sulfatireligans]VGO21435.1 Shikimate dehydrogenase (NADP(+)) [Pontiella sulfatireligans]